MYIRKLLNKKDSDTVLYIIGIIVAVLIAASYAILYFLEKKYTNLSVMHQCVFNKLTGFNCPGCGGTRSFIFLLHGKIIKSIIYYPFVPYAVTIGLVFYISQTLRFLTRGQIKGLHFRNSFIVIGIILIAGNWIVKNLIILLSRFLV